MTPARAATSRIVGLAFISLVCSTASRGNVDVNNTAGHAAIRRAVDHVKISADNSLIRFVESPEARFDDETKAGATVRQTFKEKT